MGRRTAEQIEELLVGYWRRKGTRAEYCRQQGITTSALDYYLRRYQNKPRMARVTIAPPAESASATPFTLVLRNGRRIECGWTFGDADLGRLIRVAEAE